MAKKGSILVCDDEEIMRDVLETILADAGYKVDLAKTGEEVVQAYKGITHVGRPNWNAITANTSRKRSVAQT